MADVKISTLLLILLLSLVALGYVVEKKTGRVTQFLSQQGIDLGKGKDNNNLTSENTNNSAFGGSVSPATIDLPEGFKASTYRAMPSAFVLFESNVTAVTDESFSEELWFTISQYFSKNDYETSLTTALDPKSYPGLRAVPAAVSNYKIGGEEAVQHILSLYDNTAPEDGVLINYYFIAIPSKFVIISFEHIPDFPDQAFTIPEIMNIISLIKFDNNPSKALVSAKKTPEQEAADKAVTNTQEALGISVGLPEGKKLETHQSSKSITDGATNIDLVFILLAEDSGIMIEKYLSKTDFDKVVSNAANIPTEEGVIRLPPENYKVGDQDATQYHYSINKIDMYQIVVPSKLVSINFVLQALPNYSIEDVKKIISTIKFNY